SGNGAIAYNSSTGVFTYTPPTAAGISAAAASHTHATSDITSGTFADARIAQSNVTQHQAALSITESQISDLGNYITLTDLSVGAEASASGDGALSYNSSTGVFTYTPPTLAGLNGSIDDLSDVTLTSTATNDILRWNGSAFVNTDAPTLDSLQFDLTAAETAAAGKLAWNSEDLTLDLGLDTNVTLQIGQEQLARIKAASAIRNGMAVYVSGVTGGSDNLEGTPFSADSASGVDELRFLGIATEALSTNAVGFVTTFGKVRGVNGTTYASGGIRDNADTDSWSVGDILYASANIAGTLTSVVPTAPDRQMPIAIVLKAPAETNLTLFVRAEHGYHLNELHDVLISGTPADNEVLAYDSASGNWINQTAAEAGIAATGHTHSTSDITSGTFADARIAESNVTQHQAALSITESQISDLGSYITASSTDNLANKTFSDHITVAEIAAPSTPSTGFGAIYAKTDGKLYFKNDAGTETDLTAAGGGGGSGTVTSVDMSVPTGFAISGNPITTSGTFALAFDTGYSLPTTSSQTNWNTAYGWGDHSTAGYLTDITGENLSSLSDVTITSIASGELIKWNGSAWINNTLAEAGIAATGHTHATSDITSGTFADARIAESNVTQHQAALSITESQISDFGTYLTGITGESIGSLSDVTITTVASGEVLKWSGSAWINNTLAEAGIAAASHNHATSDITSGTFADARIAESNVTQHQAALSITESQISDIGSYQDVDTTLDSDTGNEVALDLSYTVNKATSGNDTGIKVNKTDTLSPGTSLLMDLQTGGVTQVSADDSGAISCSSISATGTIQTNGGDISTSTGDISGISFTFSSSSGIPAIVGTDVNGTMSEAYSVSGADTDLISGTAGTSGDLAIWNATGDIVDGPTPPSGVIIGTTDSQTLTNKTFDDDITVKEIAAPSTPSTGYGTIYAKTDGKLYFKNDAGTETDLTAGAGAGSGTVTSVDMTVPTGFAISGNPITSSGTLALAFDTGYSLPTTTKQTNWDTAYGWGDHSVAGYLTDITGENLSTLADVTITSIASGEILKWSGSAWINNTLAEAGVATLTGTENLSNKTFDDLITSNGLCGTPALTTGSTTATAVFSSGENGGSLGGNTGTAKFQSGQSTSGDSGDVLLTSGDSAGGGNTGSVTIGTGSCSASGYAGDIILDPGTDGAGSPPDRGDVIPDGVGTINFGTAAAPWLACYSYTAAFVETGAGTNYVAFTAPSSIASDVTWTLPNADGSSGQVLSTNGSGTLSWATVSGGGGIALTDLSVGAEASASGDGAISYDNTTGVFTYTPPTAAGISAITASSTDTLTNKTFDANGTGNSLSNVETADIASGSKSGSDTTLVTGTAGTNGNLVSWNADGDVVDSSIVASNVALTDGDTYTGTHDFGGATLEVPNGAAPSLSVAGQIALDTSTTDHTALLKYHDGTNEFVIPAILSSGLSTTDNDVIAYNAANNRFEMEAQSGSGGGISNVVEDGTPQLGGQLDVNGNAIGDGTLELLTFTEDASAVNHVNIENEATGSGPIISAAGDDTNIDLNLSAKGTGNISLGNITFDADQTIGSGQDNYVLTYDHSAGTISLEAASGGGGGISNVVEDTTPQLGGDLDVNGNSIVSVSNGDIVLAPDGTGVVQVNDQLVVGSSTTDLGTATIYGHDAADEALIIRAASSQSADLVEIQNNSGTKIFSINSDGSTLNLASSNGVISHTGNQFFVRRGTSTTKAFCMDVFTSNGFRVSEDEHIGFADFTGGFDGAANTTIRRIADAHLAINGASATDTCQVTVGSNTSLGTLTIYGHDAADETLVVRAASSQSADILQIQDNSGTELVTVDSSGKLGINSASPNATLTVNGSMSLPIESISATDTLDDTNHTVLVDASGGSRTVNLPAASGSTGKIFIIKKTDSSSNNVVIDPNGAETIDGSSTFTFNSQYRAVTIQCDGSNWHIISSYIVNY
ncbi:MAG: hypothetical protein VW683_10160, partial [Betaproteobacteria bacterium]